MPVAPYPGLRPFLDHEEILLFGRERQVREVLERLRQTQFVAVIGGSGSGKSSLILAGVVPELRSFGIPGAGDYWVPMVCTPGTNASVADQAQRLNTPITRLARKFASLLRSRGSPEQDEARLAEIAARLREELGFSNLVELYTDELAVPPGPRPQDARFLFVIDQFEELFHPTTRHVDDARLLVERVIDHFFSPHPRCYVVLTMRSEHLNDCAGFLELPDAINKASYLVRRLDEAEMREAITSPAERLLRLRRLAEDDTARLPRRSAVRRRRDGAPAEGRQGDQRRPRSPAAAAACAGAAVAGGGARVASRLDLPDRIEPADLAVAASAPAGGAGAAAGRRGERAAREPGALGRGRLPAPWRGAARACSTRAAQAGREGPEHRHVLAAARPRRRLHAPARRAGHARRPEGLARPTASSARSTICTGTTTTRSASR